MLAESSNSSYKNATVMFQLLVEQYTTLVNCVQNWQGSTIKQQRLWVLLPTQQQLKILLNECLVPPGQSEHCSFSIGECSSIRPRCQCHAITKNSSFELSTHVSLIFPCLEFLIYQLTFALKFYKIG